MKKIRKINEWKPDALPHRSEIYTGRYFKALVIDGEVVVTAPKEFELPIDEEKAWKVIEKLEECLYINMSPPTYQDDVDDHLIEPLLFQRAYDIPDCDELIVLSGGYGDRDVWDEDLERMTEYRLKRDSRRGHVSIFHNVNGTLSERMGAES